MATNTWIDNYYVDASGVWIRTKKNRRTNGSPAETANGIAMPTAAIQRMTGKSLMENITDLIKMAGW